MILVSVAAVKSTLNKVGPIKDFDIENLED